MSTALWIWVEGPSDVQFFDGVVKPIFEQHYGQVIVREYSEMERKECCGYIKAIKRANDHYLCVTDMDTAPCVTERKRLVKERRFGNLVNEDRMVVVKLEIEGWYLAGLSKDSCSKLRIRFMGDTNSLTKEQCENLIGRRYDSKNDFLADALSFFDIQIACQKNISFNRFMQRYCSD